MGIEDYTIEKTLGVGSYGSVYLAKNKTGELVAIKAYSAKQMSLDTILAEYKLVKSLERKGGCGKGIICYYDFFHDENWIYIVMEYLSGFDFVSLVTNRVIKTKKELLSTYLHLARTLAMLHSVSVIHRDIKLENIMFNTEKMILVFIDFTSACQGACFNKGRHVYWTEDYGAPETATYKSKEFLDLEEWKKLDVWALGIVFYELATSQQYFKGITPLKIEKLSPDLKKIVGFILVEDPDKRPSSQEILNFLVKEFRAEKKHGTETTSS